MVRTSPSEGSCRSESSENPNSRLQRVCGERSLLQLAPSITDSRAETDSQRPAANTNREGADCAHVKSSFEKPEEGFLSRYCPALQPASHRQDMRKQLRRELLQGEQNRFPLEYLVPVC